MTGGKGGTGGGRASSPLRYENDAAGSTKDFTPLELPAGASPSREWQVVGVSRAEPVARPGEVSQPGSTGTAGDGDAAWRRRLAPHHRDAVKRFFTSPKGQ